MSNNPSLQPTAFFFKMINAVVFLFSPFLGQILASLGLPRDHRFDFIHLTGGWSDARQAASGEDRIMLDTDSPLRFVEVILAALGRFQKATKCGMLFFSGVPMSSVVGAEFRFDVQSCEAVEARYLLTLLMACLSRYQQARGDKSAARRCIQFAPWPCYYTGVISSTNKVDVAATPMHARDYSLLLTQCANRWLDVFPHGLKHVDYWPVCDCPGQFHHESAVGLHGVNRFPAETHRHYNQICNHVILASRWGEERFCLPIAEVCFALMTNPS